MSKNPGLIFAFALFAAFLCYEITRSMRPPGPIKFSNLHQAAIFGPDQIPDLIAAGAKVDELDKDSHTPLWHAISTCYPRSVRVLIEHRADPNLTGSAKDAEPPLLTATFMGNTLQSIEIVRTLIDAGADVNTTQSKYKETPLHYATRSGNRTISEALLKAGGNPNVQSKNGSTPLQYAVSDGHVEIAKLLLENGADPEIRNDASFRPIDQINACPNPEAIRKIFREAGQDDTRRPELFTQNRIGE